MEILCDNCGGDDLRYKRGCLTCLRCGVVGQREIDETAEWRTFQDVEGGEDMCRVGEPLDEENIKGMITCIGDGPGAAALRRAQQYMIQCEKQYCKSSLSHRPNFEKDMFRIATNILNVSDNGVSIAKEIVAHTREKVEACMNNAYQAAIVFFACKVNNSHLHMNQVVNAFDTTVKKFHHACAAIQLALIGHPFYKDIVKTPASNDMLKQMVYAVDAIEGKDKWCVIRTSRRLLEIVGNMTEYKGQRPSKINATVIFIACCVNKLNTKKQDISQALDVSLVTMTKHEQLLQKLLKARS